MSFNGDLQTGWSEGIPPGAGEEWHPAEAVWLGTAGAGLAQSNQSWVGLSVKEKPANMNLRDRNVKSYKQCT